MSDEEEKRFFQLRQEGKTYISKVFSYNSQSMERIRQVRMVIDGSDRLHLGEIEGAMCLRLTGEKRKTQVTAYVSQDDKQIRRVVLQSFQTRAGDWLQAYEKDEFTFRSDEFERLLAFLKQIEFINLSNEERFQIEDISTHAGRKTIIDSSDSEIVKRIKSMGTDQREAVIRGLQGSLTRVCGHSGFPKALISDSSFQKGVCNGRKAICFE